MRISYEITFRGSYEMPRAVASVSDILDAEADDIAQDPINFIGYRAEQPEVSITLAAKRGAEEAS